MQNQTAMQMQQQLMQMQNGMGQGQMNPQFLQQSMNQQQNVNPMQM